MMNNSKYYKKFRIGYNGSDDFFEKIVLPFEKYISSVYAVPPKSTKIPNSRWDVDIAPKKLLKLRKQLKEKNINFTLVYNFNGIENPSQNFLERLKLVADYYSPDTLAVPNTFVLDFFSKLTDYNLELSIIHDVNSVNQLNMLMEKTERRIDGYVIGRRKTYDLEYIKKVKKSFPNLKLKLMVNEGCIFECPDQMFHSCTLTMMKEATSYDRNVFYCQKLDLNSQWRFLTGQYIPPKFLENYCELVDGFKLGTRRAKTREIAKILKEYIDAKDITIYRAMASSHGGSAFISNIVKNKIPETYKKSYPEDFFTIRSNCKHECAECNYCKKFLLSKS